MKSVVLPSLNESHNRGLQNEGCTCYMNSLMQIFYHINPFRDFIQSLEMPSKVYSSDSKALSALQNLFYNLSQSSSSPVSTVHWIQCYEKPSGVHIDPFVEEDAHEYLNEFLERIESICKSMNQRSIVHNLFESSMHVTLKCPNCGVISSSSEIFNCIGIDGKGYNSLHDSLNHTFEVEDIESFNCDHCGKVVTIQKQSSFSQTARYLFFHLKRFEYNNKDNIREKIYDEFCFEPTLLLPVADKTIRYQLKGIVTHSGDANGGHYVSYIKEKDRWVEFNDTEVSVCTNVTSMFHTCFGSNHVSFSVRSYQ